MSKEFRTLLGNRIYLEIPKQEEGKIIVDSNTKEELQKAYLKKMNKLKVHSVGTGSVDSVIKEGDFVLVDPLILREAKIVPLTDEEDVLLISSFDVIHIW